MSVYLIDMDGPLADFDRHFWDRCIEKGYTFDIGGVADQRHRYFTEHLPNREARAHARRMVDSAGWFRALPVTPGAHAAMDGLLSEGHEVWVCSKPLDSNPTGRDEKAAWLAEHFPELAGRLILAPDKSLIFGDYLIDDAPKSAWFTRAAWEPVIFDCPFNREGTPWEHLTRCRWDDSNVGGHGIVFTSLRPAASVKVTP